MQEVSEGVYLVHEKLTVLFSLHSSIFFLVNSFKILGKDKSLNIGGHTLSLHLVNMAHLVALR